MKTSSQNTLSNHKKLDNNQPRFLAISPFILRTDTYSDFKVYLYHNNQYVLYTKERDHFTKHLKKKLYDHDIEYIYVPYEQKKEYDRYVKENFETILNDSEIPVKERSRVFLDTSNNLVQEIFESKLPSGLTRDYLDKVKEIVCNTMDFLNLQEAMENIGRLISHDYKTYSHSVHVFTYTMALLNNHDYSFQDKLDVGIGALLHDLGKRKIPRSIINKPGKLERDEWEMIKKHPVFGMGLCSNLTLSDLSLKCILFHHEKFDGSGYPTGLQGENIPLPIRFLTCCDVYDAITSNRPYAKAEKSFNALKIMRNYMHGSFDMHVYKELVMLLSNSKIT